jgi:hypothetical protein
LEPEWIGHNPSLINSFDVRLDLLLEKKRALSQSALIPGSVHDDDGFGLYDETFGADD